MCSLVCLSHLVTWNRTHCTLYAILACRNVWITRSRGLHLTHNSRLQCRIMQRLPFDHSARHSSLIDLRLYDFILSLYRFIFIHSYLFFKNLRLNIKYRLFYIILHLNYIILFSMYVIFYMFLRWLIFHFERRLWINWEFSFDTVLSHNTKYWIN